MEATSFPRLIFPATSSLLRENVRRSACLSPARRSTPMRALQEDELSVHTSPDSGTIDRDKLNQNRFVALFGRIQNLISEEQSQSKNNQNSSADSSVQKFLHQSTSEQDHGERPARKGRKPKKDNTIPSPTATPLKRDEYKGANIEGSSSKGYKESEKFTEMKVSELKLLAKEIRIRGYSKLKKSELIELLRSRV